VAPPYGATDCHFNLYDPDRHAHADAAAYLELQRRLGLSRGVLVQPSAYGFDNSLHLDALKRLGRDRFRMVAWSRRDGAVPGASPSPPPA
jgi:predicted TIM-barrel fold metal-dependent hydrolase